MKSIYLFSTLLIVSLLVVVFVNLDFAYADGPKQERSQPRFMEQLNDEQKAEMESMMAELKAAGATREDIHIAVKNKLDEFGIRPPEKGERKDGRGFRGPRHDGPMFLDQLTDEQRTTVREKVDELKDQGASREEIHEAVTEMLKSYGIEPPEPMREHRELMRQLTPAQHREVRDTVREMRQNSASREEIREAVNALLKQYGLQVPGNDQQPETEASSGENTLEIENFPNPFNPETTIKYVTPAEGQVTIQIYDIQGKLVRSLLNEFQSAGTHTLRWDGLNQTGTRVPSGTYFLRVTAGTEKVSKRIIMTK